MIRAVDDANIEIKGAINETLRRWNYGERQSRLIAVSDGTLLKCLCDDLGCWRFEVLIAGCAGFELIENNEVMLTTPYSEVFQWVLCDREYALRGADADQQHSVK